MMEGYTLIRSDHPSNNKRGGVCIYYKESLAVWVVNTTSLFECLVCEVTTQIKKVCVAVAALLNLNPFSGLHKLKFFKQDFVHAKPF